MPVPVQCDRMADSLKALRRLIVVEPWLRDFNGHPYRYSKALVSASRGCGTECMIVGACDVDPVLAQALPIVPIFRTFVQNRPSQPVWLRVPCRLFHCIRDVARLRRLLSSDDVVFVTSADAFHVLAFALLGLCWLPRSSFVVMLRYGIPGGRSATRLGWRLIYRLAFLLSPWRQRYRYVSDSALLVEEYRALGADVVTLVGIPHGESSARSVEPKVNRHSDRIVVGVVGHTVADKGVAEAVDAICAIAVEPIAARLQFIVQLYPPPNTGRQLVDQLAKKLAHLSGAFCLVRKGALQDHDYEHLLDSLDAAMFPYYPERYQGTSGIFVELACRGKPAVITRQTWMASLAGEQGLACVKFDARSVASLCAALRELVARWDQLVVLAAAKAQPMARFHSAEGVLQAVLAK